MFILPFLAYPPMNILGIDIGGSAIKGAVVDTLSGQLITERHRIETPQPAKPKAMVDVIAEIAKHFNWNGPIGCGYPGVIQNQKVLTAANLDKSWVGEDLAHLIHHAIGSHAFCLNDADAAGLAEVNFGAGKGKKGTLMLITVGTGLGTALFNNGELFPNSELGHIFLKNGKEAEKWASAFAREKQDLSWKHWAKRFDKYLKTLHALLWPDAFIIGGGLASKSEKFLPYLSVKTEVLIAQQGNCAGISGAAFAARIALSKNV